MSRNDIYDVIIIGGSYAGLSAALGLGRALRKTLIIDNAKPSNLQTPYTHNFLTMDGESPLDLLQKARTQVACYTTIHFVKGIAIQYLPIEWGFQIRVQEGDQFIGKKLLLATGIKDLLPAIPGLAECWGRSFLHCPYCHGYEVRHQAVGVLGNGHAGFELTRHIHQWTRKLTLFTNGNSTLTQTQACKLQQNNIAIVEMPIHSVLHTDGDMHQVMLKDGSRKDISVIFGKVGFVHQNNIYQQLGCALTENGYLEVDACQRTSVPGVYAAGDITNAFRTLSTAVAEGTKAAAYINKDLIEASF